jgi:hypothetical protein
LKWKRSGATVLFVSEKNWNFEAEYNPFEPEPGVSEQAAAADVLRIAAYDTVLRHIESLKTRKDIAFNSGSLNMTGRRYNGSQYSATIGFVSGITQAESSISVALSYPTINEDGIEKYNILRYEINARTSALHRTDLEDYKSVSVMSSSKEAKLGERILNALGGQSPSAGTSGSEGEAGWAKLATENPVSLREAQSVAELLLRATPEDTDCY